MLLNGGGPMRYIMAVLSICVVLSIPSVVSAAQQIDYLCKTECVARGGTFGQCNAMCAATDSSENQSKNTDCMSACLKEKGLTRYNCYRECGSTGDGGAAEQNVQEN